MGTFENRQLLGASNIQDTYNNLNLNNGEIKVDLESTELEVADGRTDNVGSVWESVGVSLRNSATGGYLLFKKPAVTSVYALSVKAGEQLIIKIKNTSISEGYFRVAGRISTGAERIVFTNTVLILAGAELVTPVMASRYNFDEIRIENVNARTSELTVIGLSTKESIAEVSDVSNQAIKQLIETEYAKGQFGYLTATGVLKLSTSGTSYVTDQVLGVSVGDKFKYTGSYGWAPVWGYTESGTPIEILPAGTYEDSVFEITDPTIKSIIAFTGSGTLSLKNVILQEEFELAELINESAILLSDLTVSVLRDATISNKTERGIDVTLGVGVNSQANFNSTAITINAGDFIFGRITLVSDADALVTFYTYPDFLSISYDTDYVLKAGVEREIYFRTINFTASGTFHFGIETYPAEANGQVISIKDMIFVKNSYEAWSNIDDRVTLKDFTSTELIVAPDAGGQFIDIDEACTFAKRAFDVAIIPVTIKIRNGYYLQPPMAGFPYAAINKGSNRISLIGESTDGVVIECYNTATLQNKVVDIGGECSVENMTIRSLNDGTYNLGNDLGNNCYGIHNDSFYDTTEVYYTTVKNCKIYSVCHSPIGAGLRNKQVQRYENCEFISDGILSAGALYVHGSNDLAGIDMSVEIVNCSCVSLDGTKALTLPDVAGALQYTDIPVIIQRTIGYTTGADVTDGNFQIDKYLQPQSALNNVAVWNY